MSLDFPVLNSSRVMLPKEAVDAPPLAVDGALSNLV